MLSRSSNTQYSIRVKLRNKITRKYLLSKDGALYMGRRMTKRLLNQMVYESYSLIKVLLLNNLGLHQFGCLFAFSFSFLSV